MVISTPTEKSMSPGSSDAVGGTIRGRATLVNRSLLASKLAVPPDIEVEK